MNAEIPGPLLPELPGRPVELVLRGPTVAVDRAWGLVGDTDWLNQVAGNGVIQGQGMELQADGLPVLTGALTGPGGLPLPFEEAWTSWVRGRYFRQVRSVKSPLLQGTEYLATLEPDGSGVRPVLRLNLFGARFTRPVLSVVSARFASRWQGGLDALSSPPQALRELPPAAEAAFDRWARGAGSGGGDPELVQRVRDYIRGARPTALRRMRPFALADAWGMDRDRVLDALLDGVLVGAMELYWSVRCVRCHGQVGGGSSLSDLADHAECPSCRLSFDNDLGRNVEALVTPHPAVVPRLEERFCTLYPSGAPEHEAVWTLPAGGTIDEQLELSEGAFHLGPGGGVPDTQLEVGTGGSTELEWRASDPPARLRLARGPVRLRVLNDLPGRQRVQLTRDGQQQGEVAAAVLTTRPRFRRMFGHQVLAPDLRLSVRAVSLLFTDLSGSTAMYESIGDAAAFAVVRDHFGVLRACIEAEHGVIVKTIGDAVMAAFDGPVRATRAALACQGAFQAWVPGLGLDSPPGLKIGLHTGPALAVHSDASGLDWFGGTVNLAARAESLASRGDIILTEAAAQDPEVQALLQQRGLVAEPLERTVKGFRDSLRFVRLRAA